MGPEAVSNTRLRIDNNMIWFYVYTKINFIVWTPPQQARHAHTQIFTSYNMRLIDSWGCTGPIITISFHLSFLFSLLCMEQHLICDFNQQSDVNKRLCCDAKALKKWPEPNRTEPSRRRQCVECVAYRTSFDTISNINQCFKLILWVNWNMKY